MTNRLDRMEEAGLIRRLPDPSDRRGQLIEPTEKGHAMWDKAVGTQAKTEALLAETLTKAEREELHRLLRRLMKAFPAKAHWAEAPISAEPDPQAVGAAR
jgi:DNA-binding MarR family transcriptional regulator